MKNARYCPHKGKIQISAAFQSAWHIATSGISAFANRSSAFLIRVAVLLSAVLLMLPAVTGHSVTAVEFAQLPAGLAAWQRQSLGIYRVCAPLSKFIYSLPAHLAGIRVDYPEEFDSDIQRRHEWQLGRIFQNQNHARYHDIFRWSRLLPVLTTLLGACVVCEWSTRLFGLWPGIVSLCAWCWLPPVLALGSLVTSDMLAAVMLVVAARCYWSFLVQPGFAKAILAGVTLGLAPGTKFTLLVLYPCWTLLLAARTVQVGHAMRGALRDKVAASARIGLQGLAMFSISVVVLDAIYLFDGVGIPLRRWEGGRSALAIELGRLENAPLIAGLFRAPMPIPIELLRGIDFQLADSDRPQATYLMGQSRLGGWWYWYAVAMIVKLPLPVLVLVLWAAFQLICSTPAQGRLLWAVLCTLIPAGEVCLLIATTTGSGTNAAFRYLLPCLAPLCIWVGIVWNSPSRSSRSLVVSLLGWLILNAVIAIPDHLGWQNEVSWLACRWTGRPAIIGDSLDWGQDVARLGHWVSRNCKEGNVVICVYGFGGGEVYGLRPPRAKAIGRSGGNARYLALSENILFGYGSSATIELDGCYGTLDPLVREPLLRIRFIARVGRTIRIYRIEDLPFDFLPQERAAERGY